MSENNVFEKRSDERLDYVEDWEDWLKGDTITASTWDVPSGLTLVSDSFTTTDATAWFYDGVLDTVYECVNHIDTAASRKAARTIYITIVNR